MANNFVRCNQLGKWDFYLRTFSLLITVDAETTHVHSVFCSFGDLLREANIYERIVCSALSFSCFFFFFKE